ncbi:MAG: endopeptidase La [Chloroflexi bacterium]|nr:endopeptidase La [Chloroflexota bacterium]
MAKQVKPSQSEFDEWLGEDLAITTEDFDIEEFPVLPLRDTVVYPHMVAPLFVGRERSVKAIEAAMANNQRLVALAQLDEELEEPEPHDLYVIGTEVVVGRMLRMPDGTISIWVQGQRRVKVQRFTQQNPYLAVEVTPVKETSEQGLATEALMRAVLALFEKVVQYSRNIPDDAYVAAMNADEPGWLADLVASTLELSVAKRQELLEMADATMRLQKLSVILASEIDVLELQNRINSQVQSEVDKSQREYYLHEQLRVIQNELGETDPYLQDVNELREKLSQLKLPDEVRSRVEKELGRLSSMSSASPEVGVIRTYIDWILELPWNQYTEDKLDITEAAKILDESHYGLPKAKERILEHLAVRQLAADKMKNPILCFVGPPGTGKTSLGKSIALALGRKFVRISLGGIRDEAEIRGHRRTYVGALPGRIIQTMRRAESSNPVFMLDEIDKVGSDFRGDPSAALLEVLDPEQNYAFSDHYLELPYDLSKVMFITTANTLEPVPPALLDRMEVIEFPGYVEEEKIAIARKFLIPHQLEQNGIKALHFTDNALSRLIREYTQEAGVRNLDREIANICRKAARRIAEGKQPPRQVVAQSLVRYIGPPRFLMSDTEQQDMVGVATGLAWTEAGGDTLSIEVTVMNGKGNLLLTGQLGEVMQESAQAALSYTRSRADSLGISDIDFDKIDIHIHVPEGAVPKDGPSAGITMATALISALTGRAVKHGVAMTGEITLRGRVLPIGGLREKLLAARRAGLTTVLVPARNRPDMIEVPRHLQKGMNYMFVERMDDVLPLALQDKPMPVSATKARRQKAALPEA